MTLEAEGLEVRTFLGQLAPMEPQELPATSLEPQEKRERKVLDT